MCFESVCLFFSLMLGTFLYCFYSPYILEVCFTSSLASSDPSCGPFNDTISSALRPSFFRVLLLFILIRFHALSPLPGQALLLVIM